jgi:hypothetical protein
VRVGSPVGVRGGALVDVPSGDDGGGGVSVGVGAAVSVGATVHVGAGVHVEVGASPGLDAHWEVDRYTTMLNPHSTRIAIVSQCRNGRRLFTTGHLLPGSVRLSNERRGHLTMQLYM